MKIQISKQAIIFCLFAICFITSKGQVNIVRDPSFEDTTTCSDNLSIPVFLNSWKTLDSTKYHILTFFLYHTCSSGGLGLPNNGWLFQNPRSGNAVAEILTLSPASPTYHRTYTRIKLESTLQSGQTYCAKMYVNAPDKQGDYFTDGIQMYFDNGQLDTIVDIDSLGPYTFVNPQVSNPSGHILKDTMNWELVGGTFLANGTETFLTIGNFKSDSNTDTLRTTFSTNPTFGWSDLIIDDVSVIPIDVADWLQDTSCILGDSVYIGLPMYEYTDGMWYDINMNYLGKGSGIKVMPTQWATKYIMQIDLCGIIRSDTLTVWAAPAGITENYNASFELFPNPASSEIVIRFSGNGLINDEVFIYNTLGELVKVKKINSTGQLIIPISDLSNGIYYLKYQSQMKRFLKE